MSDKEDVLKELKTIQSQLYAGLKDIRIAINADKNPEVIEAIIAIYGEDFIAGMPTVSFDMYIQCMEIIKQAGKDKGDQLTGEYLI